MQIKQPRKSKLKLNSIKYIKVVVDGEETYFFQEKTYVSKWDGYIDLKDIDEEVFMEAYYNQEFVEVMDLQYTKTHVRNYVLKLKGDKTNE